MNTIAKETQTGKQFEQLRTEGRVGRRAESLADRIEEGAAVLAAFAEGMDGAGACGGDRRLGTMLDLRELLNHILKLQGMRGSGSDKRYADDWITAACRSSA